MAPPLMLIFTSLLFLSLHISMVQSENLVCSSKDCRKNSCPSSCPCLGIFIDCGKRNLNEVPKDLPVWVGILDLRNNNISIINDKDFEGLTKLRELDLSNNQLEYINASALELLTSLQKLTIDKNHLKEVPKISHPSLSAISLQHNQIENLGDLQLQNLPKIHTIDIGFNSISALPEDTFGNSSSLRHLSLNHNRIMSIEKGVFANLSALESLKLSKNKFTTIPKELFRYLRNLRHLELNSNSLTQIEGLTFQGLTSLALLRLRHSSIAQLLDGAFYGLNDIKKLHLDFNNISKITKGWLYGLNSLQRLYLNNNNISEIEDDAWDSCKRLLELDMNQNKLQFITSKTFDKLFSLKRLILSNNMITYIDEGAFRSLAALQFLELRNNKLSWTIEDTGHVFSGLDRLKHLGLANNLIQSVVKRAFDGLARLSVLDLDKNEITTIEENAFSDLPLLEELTINSSSLICDCHLSWLSRNYPIVAKCGYPQSLEGHSMFDVPQKNFICGSPKPVMIKEPLTKRTLKGENVTLHCQAQSSGESDVRYLWRKDGKFIQGMWLWQKSENTKVGNFTLHSSWLSIQNIQNKDEGHYQCIISNRYGSVYSNKAHITVHVFPVFTRTPVNVAVKSGSAARLECGAKGQPQPDITWRKDVGQDKLEEDFPAASERRFHVMHPTDDTFFIVNVTPIDSGVYTCTAKNVAGVITTNATLTVLETPSFVKKMEDKEFLAGETAVLECMATGSPKPKLEWFKNGDALSPTDRHFFTASNQLLIIIRSKETDSGSYMCKMSNTVGSEQGTSHLNILPASQSSGSAIDESNITGIIVISVVVCVVGTSIIWVIVIHHTRKTRDDFNSNNSGGATTTTEIPPFNQYRAACHRDMKQPVTNIYLDSHSDHSKDSGTGDSAQPSNNDLLIEEDDHDLLLDIHSSSVLSGAHRMSSLLALQDNAGRSRILGDVYASSNSSVSKEQVPLLPSLRTSRSTWKSHRKSIAEFRQQPSPETNSLCYSERKWPCSLVHRSLSADQVNSSDSISHLRSCSEPPQDLIVTRVESEGTERDSGFSTFPRSITQASVSNWSTESPRLQRLPKDIPNDSGSFSIASGDIHILVNPLKCVPVSSRPTSRTSKLFVLEQET